MSKEIVPASRVAQSIHLLCGQKVMLDFDLAALYGVTTESGGETQPGPLSRRFHVSA